MDKISLGNKKINKDKMKFDEQKIENSILLLLEGIGINHKDENFLKTPERVVKSYKELLKGHSVDLDEEIKSIFQASFPSNYSGIVLITNIKCFSVCPHHLLPVEYIVDVGYISENRMVGISKLPRLVELLAKRLVLQETFTEDITANLIKFLKANGAMAVVRGKHMCMRMRGIEKPDADTITSSAAGIFLTDVSARQEFLQLTKKV